jgi:acyl-coenzyme A synthetase/AMP-(fatty) acid ligase
MPHNISNNPIGFQPLLMSPRNSAPAIINMMQKTSCHRLLTTETLLASLLSDLKKELAALPEPFEVTLQEAPWINEIYPHLGAERDTDAFTPYPASARRPALGDVMLYLHSSGSTGFPKPIPITHEAQLDSCAFRMCNL